MHICQLITLFSASSALFLNLLLVPIIITKSSERLGVYKCFLLAYTLNASIFTFSQAATLPNWYIPNNGYAFLSTITILPKEIQQILIVSFILSYVGNAIVITFSFLYRLAVIERTPNQTAIAMLFAVIFGLQNEMYPDPNMYSCRGTTLIHEGDQKIGVMYLVIGIVFQLCYICCVIVIARSSLIRMPCFKIMVYLGVIDIACLTICADLAGYWSIVGITYCMNPTLSYVLGNISMGFWASSCFCVVFLAVNRTADLIYPNMNSVFEGKRMYYWLSLPTLYGLYFIFFERPLLYSPGHHTFFFDPCTNYSLSMGNEKAKEIYANLPHSINNIIVIISLLSLYFVMISTLLYKMKFSRAALFSNMTRQLFLQLLIICGCHVLGGFLYVYTQFFPVPAVFTVITNLAWIGNHGLPGVVYLFLNKTIRHKVFTMLGLKSQKSAVFITGAGHHQMTF